MMAMAVTDEVEAQSHDPGDFDNRDFVLRNLQETLPEQEVTSSERLTLLVIALMGALRADLFLQSQ